MKHHTKIYFEGMKIHPSEWVACEWCGQTAVDVHHLSPRGKGSSKTKDYIENLMGLCRSCHLKAESRELSREELTEKHLKNIP